MPRLLITVIAALSLLVAGCGDDSNDEASEEEQAYIDALGDVFFEQALLGDGVDATREEADCIAATMIGVLGTTPLVEAGLTPEALAESDASDLEDLPMEPDDAEAEELWEGITDCIDLGAMMAKEMTLAGLSDESAACIGEGIVLSDPFREQMIGSMVAPDDIDADFDRRLDSEFERLAEECLTPEEMAELGM